jgi:type VI protein secretion system component VasF
VDTQEQARAQRARDALGDALDDIETRFAPDYVGKIAAFTIKRSFRRHRVWWGVAGGVAAAIALGLIVWAVMSDDD